MRLGRVPLSLLTVEVDLGSLEFGDYSILHRLIGVFILYVDCVFACVCVCVCACVCVVYVCGVCVCACECVHVHTRVMRCIHFCVS